MTHEEVEGFNGAASVAGKAIFEYIERKQEDIYVVLVTLRTRHLGLVCLSILPLLFSRCAIYDFFSQRYENATAYFNTYYNAKRLYDEALADVEALRLSSRITDMTETVELTPQTRQKFNQVIEKCSKLLQFHSKSKWVDDALFVIGTSYFYLGDDRKAQRKFVELLSTFPKSGYVLRANLWLGRSLFRMQDYGEATRVLEELVQSAHERKKMDILLEGTFLLGRIFSDQSSYSESIRVYRRIVETSKDDRARAQGQLRIGNLYADQDSLHRAIEAYRAVLEFDPDEHVQFEAEFQRALTLNQIGRHEDALEVLQKLRDEIRSDDYYPQIDLELANTYTAMGLIDEAIDQYEFTDTTYARTEVSARGYFALGLLYEKKLLDFNRAMESYGKSRTEFPKADVTSFAQSKWRIFQNYFRHFDSIAKSDSLLFELENRPSSTTSADSSSVQPDSVVSDTALAAQMTVDSSAHVTDDSSASVLRESYLANRAEAMYGLGNLFLLDINIPDSAEYWYQRVISEHPGSDVVPRALYTLADIYRSSENASRDTVNRLYQTLIEDYSETQFADEARRFLGMDIERMSDPAAADYARGERLLLEGNIDGALLVLRSLIHDYPESPSVTKSKYALGWIFENLKIDLDSARGYYRQVLDESPNSAYAEAVKAKLLEAESPDEEAESSLDPVGPELAPEKKDAEPEKPKEPEEKRDRPP